MVAILVVIVPDLGLHLWGQLFENLVLDELIFVVLGVAQFGVVLGHHLLVAGVVCPAELEVV